MRKRHTSKGFLSTIQRKSGAVLVYRWYDPGTDGRPTERKRVLGLAKDFQSEAAGTGERFSVLVWVARLGMVLAPSRNWWIPGWRKSVQRKSPKSRRAFSTKDTYRSS